MATNTLKMMLLISAICLAHCSCDAKQPMDDGQKQEVTLHTAADMIRSCQAVLNSHAGEEQWSVMQPMYDYYQHIPHYELTGNVAESQRTAMYYRVKKLLNGDYIMFWHGGETGSRIWSSISSDFKSWSKPVLMAQPELNMINGVEDWRRYVNMDAVVMPDGELLAVYSFRATNGYTTGQGCGLMLIRSTDHGRTWSAPQQIYDGPNWEPYLLLLPDGKTIHCYFTDAKPQTKNSGTSIVMSKDGGLTWGDRIRVCRQYKYDYDGPNGKDFAGEKIFTDQMPCFRVLNDGKTIFGFIEARLEAPASIQGRTTYEMSLVWNDGLTWKSLGENEEGPSTRVKNFIKGGGGYVSTFPSGEVVINGHLGGKFKMKVLDHTGGRNSAAASLSSGWLVPFEGSGMWGSTEVDSPVTLVAGMHSKTGMEMCRFWLNHRMDASVAEITVDGKSGEWTDSQALYLSLPSKEECIIRSRRDNDNLYLLLETVTEDISGQVKLNLMLCNTDRKDPKTIMASSAGQLLCSDKSATTAFGYGVAADGRKGFVAEISIPLESLKAVSGSYIGVYATMASGSSVGTFSLSSKSDINSWQRIKIK